MNITVFRVLISMRNSYLEFEWSYLQKNNARGGVSASRSKEDRVSQIAGEVETLGQ